MMKADNDFHLDRTVSTTPRRIGSTKSTGYERLPYRILGLSLAVCGFFATMGFDLGTPSSTAPHGIGQVAAATREVATTRQPIASPTAPRWISVKVRKGDTLSMFLNRQGVPLTVAMEVGNRAKPLYNLAQKLMPGNTAQLGFSADFQLQELVYPVGDGSALRVSRGVRGNFVAVMEKLAATDGTASATAAAQPTAHVVHLAASQPIAASQLPTTSPRLAATPGKPPQTLATVLPSPPPKPKSPDTTRVASVKDSPTSSAKSKPTKSGDVFLRAKLGDDIVIRKDTVRKGDTLTQLLARSGVATPTITEVVKSSRPVYDLARNLRNGANLQLAFAADGTLRGLEYVIDSNQVFQLLRTGTQSGFKPKIASRELETRNKVVSGTINSSLFETGRRVGLPYELMVKLTGLFEWDVDFARDIHKGDRFTVVFEEQLADGKKVRLGNILAAEFVNRGHSYQVVRYEDPAGNLGYFTPDGDSIRRMFIKAPVDFTRISSLFSSNRVHPVYGYTRAHKGVDYAAPTGTPVRSTADGIVVYKGLKAGYGNLIVVRHNSTYTTAYGHLSSYATNLVEGKRVGQGDVIGRVGMTGVATGPHLHYEVRVKGQQVNPLSITSTAADPVPNKYLADFRQKTSSYTSAFSGRSAKQQVVATTTKTKSKKSRRGG